MTKASRDRPVERPRLRTIRRWLVAELALFGLAIVLAWWLGGAATSAWLARAAELGVKAPDPGAHRADALFTLGVVVLGVARVVAVYRGGELVAPWLVPAAVLACLIGLLFHHATFERGEPPSATAFAQGFAIGCVVAAVLLLVPGELAELATRRQRPVAIAIAAIFLALAVLGRGPAGSGTRINLGPIQPIELAKPLVVVFLAGFLGARAAKLRWQRARGLGLRWPRFELMVPAFGVLVATFGGLYLVGDLGPVLVLAFVFLGMFFVASRATGWALAALALVAVLLVVLGHWPHLAGGGTVQTRLRMWHDPWTNGLTHGSQLGEGLWAFAAGGWTGQGVANAATPLVAAGKTDLALATLTEQLGAAGFVLYQLLLAAVVGAGCVIAARSRTPQRVLLAAGLAILVLVQWAAIEAGTLGLLPLTGIVVPFVSAGRTSMIVFVAVIGMLSRLSLEARVRAPSQELAELHGGVRTIAIVGAAIATVMLFAGLRVTLDRHAIGGRTILARLADGTVVARENPRLSALVATIRRGAILDRDGAPLAESPAPGERRYPLGAALGTLLGIAPSKVLLPPWALERTYDQRLRGYAPDLRSFAPLLDAPVRERRAAIAELDAAIAQRSITTTLDAKLQAAVAKRLAAGHHLAAAAVVIDADTGEILARAQVPDYDPNAPAWQARVLAGDAAFTREFHGAYGAWPDKTGLAGMFQAGSVGKLFTALAAVRAGAAGARFSCTDADAQGPLFTRPGWPKPIHDHSGDRPHGALDLSTALAVSCNVYFAQLGLELGADPLRALRAAGAEVGYGDAIDPGPPGSRQLASTAFGQGVMVMSPLQAARLVAALAAGGRYRTCPLERGAPCREVERLADPAALAPIYAGMRKVMTAGTGSQLKPPTGVRVYGKTGTADVRGFAGEEPFGIARAQVARPHSWFVAFAEPATAPEGAPATPGRLAVAVVVPRGGTGASAAGPLAMQILAAARELGYLGGK
jgi:cell division protein FtsW (lipid II flippase)